MRSTLRLLPALLAGAVLPGQVLVVDVNNGPGTHFTSLVTAAVAAPDGATLTVRPGSYSGLVVIDGKGLHVLAEPGVRIVSGGLVVRNTLPHQTNVLRNLTYRDYPGFMEGVRVGGCAGLVLFERLEAVAYSYTEGITHGLSIGGSEQVLLRDSRVARLAIGMSNVVLERCLIGGRSARLPGLAGSWSSTSAVEMRGGGSLQVAHSTVEGGDGVCFITTVCSPGQTPVLPSSPAVTIRGDTVVLRTPSTVVAGSPGLSVPPVVGTGTVRVDPRVALNNPPSVSPPAQVLPMPTVQSTSAPLGGTVTGSATGPTGDTLVLVLGLPGPTSAVPGIADPFWMDGALHFFAAIGTAQPGAPLTDTVQVPNDPIWLGFRLAWQSVSYGSATGLQASQPSVAFAY